MRPYPPEHLVEPLAPSAFRASSELEAWARMMFIDPDGALPNDEHQHLRQARLGFLWTNVPMKRHGRHFLGQAELVTETEATWSKARGEFHLRQMFDGLPDFVITINAPAWAEMDDRPAMALIEHELYHCAQAKDQYGSPRFSKQTGQPIWAMRGHDAEEFVGVVERYGATSKALATMAESINAGPLYGHLDIMCASCFKR